MTTIEALDAETAEAIADANRIVEDAERDANTSSFVDQASWTLIGIVTIVVWAGAVAVTGYFILFQSPDFVCTGPDSTPTSSYTSACENGWTVASEQMFDLLATFVLPVVTLVLGYYFGQLAAGNED